MFETKENLKAYRRQRLEGWLASQGLRLDEYPFWSAAVKSLEQAEFERIDKIYEQEKTDLAKKIAAMTPEELELWTPKERA